MTLIQKKIKKVYLWTTQIRPSLFLLHLPLENSLVDTSWNWRTVTSTTTPTYSTVWWVSAITSYWTSLGLSVEMSWFNSSAYTESIWYYATWNSDWKCMRNNRVWSSDVDIVFVTNSWNGNRLSNFYVSDTFTSTSYITWWWHMYTLVRDWDSQKLYHDGSLISDVTRANQNYPYTGITILQRTWWWQQRPWYMSDFLVHSQAWSASEVLAYYNSTKSKYWY